MADQKNLRPVYILTAKRSPIAKFGGAFQGLPAGKLAAETLKKAIEQSDYQNLSTDKVIMGHARQAGAGPNTARQATIFSGLSEKIPAWTVNQACASGMAAVAQAFDRLRFSLDENIWAGGVESMSNTPYMLTEARWGKKLGNSKILDGMYQDGFHCPMADMVMGQTVEEFIAKEEKITRLEQDQFALQSQQRATESKELFKDEILPFEGILDHDEHVRSDSSLEKLSQLKPVFDFSNGSITAGNASGITDGAAWLQLSNQEKSSLQIVDYAMTALDPRKMGLGPIESIQVLLKKNQLTVEDVELFEINEAFAAQVIACQKALKIPMEKLNIRGGAIALGHPIGATGARITVTLAQTMLKSQKSDIYGVASLCVSGGMGFAILLKKSKN